METGGINQNVQVVFATPSLDHRVSLRYLRSIMQTVGILRQMGVSSANSHIGGDCFVAKARNKLITNFLREFPDCQNLFFLDDDIGWPAMKAVEFLNRPEPVVCGIYPKKCRDLDFPVSLATDLNTGELVERDGLVKAILAPTGFMRIKREVIETLASKARVFEDIEPDGNYASYAGVFESGIGPDGKWWGEDYAFGVKWMECGGEIWVDPDIAFDHQGVNTWTATLKDHLHVFRDKATDLARIRQSPAA